MVNHGDKELHLSDHVTIMCGPQKADAHQDEAISQEATNDTELNPLWHWAFTIKRLK